MVTSVTGHGRGFRSIAEEADLWRLSSLTRSTGEQSPHPRTIRRRYEPEHNLHYVYYQHEDGQKMWNKIEAAPAQVENENQIVVVG